MNLHHLNDATQAYHQALDLTPTDNITDRAIFHNQLGNIYADAGQLDTALHHYQQSIRYKETVGNRYSAGNTRLNIARALSMAGRTEQALLYAHAALRDYESCGASAADKIEQTRRLIIAIERGDFDPAD